MRIVVLDGYTLNPGDNPWRPIEQLGELTRHDRTPADLIVERAKGAPVVITNKVPFTADTLAALPDLKLICVTATGYNVVDTGASRERGIDVCNVPEYGTRTVAQYVIMLLLTLCHRPALHDRAIRDGQWQQRGDFCFWLSPQVELVGRTLAIIGFGKIGRAVGELAHALGMRVIAHTRTPSDAPDWEGFEFVTLEQAFEQGDAVTLHCPQTPDNAGMVDAALLARMKPTAYFINTARGGLVNERDLAQALHDDRLAAAALDVVSTEPISPDNPLLAAERCLLTPHIAWATHAARERVMQTTAANIAAWSKGDPINLVN